MNVSSIGSFSEWLCQDVPYKAEIWTNFIQSFSKHRSLDICRCAFIMDKNFLNSYMYSKSY